MVASSKEEAKLSFAPGEVLVKFKDGGVKKINDEKEAKETLDLFEEAGVFSSGSETDTIHGVH